MARLTGRETAGIRRIREPVTAGVPLPRGRIRDAGELVAVVGGRPAPAQFRIAERWPDGSARWALVDLAVDAEPHGSVEVEVTSGGAKPPAPSAVVRVSPAGAGVFVDARAAQWTIDPDGPFPFRGARVAGTELLPPDGCSLTCTDADGRAHAAAVRSVRSELEGPLHAVVRVDGSFPGGACPLDFVARLHFHAGSPSVRMEIAVRNPRRAAHPGGHWELGDAGSYLFRDLSLRVALSRGDSVSWSPEPAMPLGQLRRGPLEIYQDSSGGENWKSPVHRARDGEVPVRFRGYRVRAPGVERDGLRATPRVVAHHGTGGVSASVRWFWQNFPMAAEAGDGAVTVRLFPRQSAALHELQGGERKTHEVWMTFGPEAMEGGPDFQRAPLRLAPDPDTFLAAGVLPYLTLASPEDDGTACRLAAQALDGDDPFAAKRERADEYGWRHWGDLWADHESRYHRGDDLFVSHFNNQYDPVWGALLQYARGGDARWLDLLEPLARHVMDVDVYHTDEDRSVYNHGLFWHTAHYVHAGLATHRSYPRGDTVGGGPDNEHNYAAGFAHFHLLTGDAWAREAAIERAEWVLAADDGSRTQLRWIAPGPTGAASKTREPGFHGPGRGAGNSIQVLLDVWRLTAERRWLDKAVELIHRTIHPDDDPGAYDLTDSETRWSYTAHLQALGRFLDEMAEAGELGEPYAYARASLLAYARWMAEHERPALDFPDRLDHPTETWAAQDLRKSEVFRFAMLHAAGDERDRFRERAEFFWRRSLETLDGFDTKGRTRPVVLLMRYGMMDPWFRKHPDASRPEPEFAGAFPPPVRFVPQKARALKRLRWIALAAAAVAVVAVLAALLS